MSFCIKVLYVTLGFSNLELSLESQEFMGFDILVRICLFGFILEFPKLKKNKVGLGN